MSNIRLGKVSISPRGDFALGTEYDRLDVVYNHERRSSFLAKQKHTDEPLDNEEYWMLLAYGAVGKSAYETAVEAGYLGTEAEFYTELYQVTENIQKAKDATQDAHAAADRVDASIASADTATEAANTAADLANEKAALADGKATLANTAAENADAKAALAQTATEQADTATTATNAATEAATTATETANTAATLANEKAALADSKATLANTAAENADAKAALADTKAGLAATATDRANTAASACEDVIAGDLNPAVELVLANNKDKPGGLASLDAQGKLTQMPTPADLGAATAADLTALTEQFQPTAATIGSRPEGNDSLLWDNVGTRPAHKIGTLWENIGAIDSDDRTGKLYAITVTIGPGAEDQISSNMVRGKVMFYYAPVMGYGQFQVEAISEAAIPVNTAIPIDFSAVFTSQQTLYQPMHSNPNNYLSVGLNGTLNLYIREALSANADVKGSLSVVTNPANFQIPGSEFSFEEYEIPLIAGMETVKTQIQNLIASTTATAEDLADLQADVGERPADKTGTLWENIGGGGEGDVTSAQLDEVKAKLAASGDLTAIATPLQSQIGVKPNAKSKTLWEEIGTTTIKDKRGLWGLLGNWSLGSTTTVSSRLKAIYDKQIAQDTLIGTGFSAENTIAANIGERPAAVTGTLWENVGGGGEGDVTSAQLDEVKAKLAASGDLTAIATPIQSQIGVKPDTKSKTLWEEIGTTTIKDKRGLWGLLGNWSLGSTTTVSSRLKTIYDKQTAQDTLIGTGFSAENTIAANIGERPAAVTGTLWEHIGGTNAAALSAAPEYVHQELIFGDATPAEHVAITTANRACHLTKYGNVCTCSGRFTIVQNTDSEPFAGYQDQRYVLSFSAADLPFSLSHLVYGTLTVASSAVLPSDCRCFAEGNSLTLETSFSGTDGPPVDAQWNFSITFVSENV